MRVRRTADAGTFNGIVVVEWLNGRRRTSKAPPTS